MCRGTESGSVFNHFPSTHPVLTALAWTCREGVRMPATSKKNDAAMMAWYRAKKFGVARPHFEGNIPTFAGATGLSSDSGLQGQRSL